MTSIYTFLNENVIIAQAGAPQPNVLLQFAPMLLLVAGFWFLMISPQRKKQKEHDKMLTELKSGDEVVFSSGIYGTIANVKPDRFVIKIADNTKVEVTKASVLSRASEAVADNAKDEKKK
jgi:preprotein translocase subunit YajC